MPRNRPTSLQIRAIEAIAGILAATVAWPLAAQPQSCADCHPQIAESYAETGMGRSFSRLTPNFSAADFRDNNTFFHEASNRYYEAVEREGRFFLRRYQQDSDGRRINLVEKEMHYALGSGNHAIGFLHRTADNRLLQLPVSWYAADGGYWEMAPGYDRPDHAGFRRGVDLECMFCHNAYPPNDVHEVPGAVVRFSTDLPEGVDCSRCHGGGNAHAAAARNGAAPEAVRGAILNPAHLPPERQLEVCMQCHLETTTDPLPHAIRRVGRGYFSYSPAERLAEYALHFDHAPGRGYDAKFEVVNAVYRLRQSSCFLRSEAMTCTSCHDPHHAERGETASRRYDAICQKCHDPKSASGDPHLVRAGCTDCHMPKRVADDAPHVRMTDHRIGIPEFDARPRNAKAAAYRGPVELYYPEKIDNGEERELYMALAQVRGFTNLDEGLPRLTSAVRRVNPPQPDFEYFLGEGYRRQGALQSAAAAYRRSLGTDPAFWPAALGLGLALANSGDLTGAIATLEPHRTADVSAAVALGDFYYRSGRWVDARETLLSALEMDPDSPEAHNNLAAVYAAQQRLAGAEAEAREAIRNRPDYAAAHANLGAILLAAGRPTEAVASYDQALALGAEAGAVEAGRKRALDVLGGGQP